MLVNSFPVVCLPVQPYQESDPVTLCPPFLLSSALLYLYKPHLCSAHWASALIYALRHHPVLEGKKETYGFLKSNW